MQTMRLLARFRDESGGKLEILRIGRDRLQLALVTRGTRALSSPLTDRDELPRIIEAILSKGWKLELREDDAPASDREKDHARAGELRRRIGRLPAEADDIWARLPRPRRY